MDGELHLTELIAADKLQAIQDAFTKMTGIAAGICDISGEPVTEYASGCEFCTKYTKGTEAGRRRCNQCDLEGGLLGMGKGKAVTYVCHAGLVDFAAPIVVDGKLVGVFNGGQVRVGNLDEERILRTAEEIGVDPAEYLAAAYKAEKVPVEKLVNAMDFIYTFTRILSEMGFKQYQIVKGKEEVERAARMKSDFLANMSHEIRTPMNSVIGMAELALREELPPAAREYIQQIKSSGRTLLTIINDILDFSKIESGKMDIQEEEYEPMSLVNDMANILLTRIGDKDVEVVFDIEPTLPRLLLGDSVRIKQALLNLGNNAVKFTEKGEVHIRVSYERLGDGRIDLRFAVSDTGTGIRKEDLVRIFDSFQQVDSKRNRQIEGTGLGLAISRNLVEMMGGDLQAESEFGKGSTFWFHVPQRIAEDMPGIVLRDTRPISPVGVMLENPYISGQLKIDIERFGGSCMEVRTREELEEAVCAGVQFVFVEQVLFSETIREFARSHGEVTVVVLIDMRKKLEAIEKNILIVHKPVYSLPLANIFNHENVSLGYWETQDDNFRFIAPNARILIVDDNVVNLKVAEGLLEPMKMQIDTADSGQEAIDMVSARRYDLIFMDHMMPELDGVETTHIIRRFHPEYSDVPIIALTANAVDGTREMFITEGMNDFVAKPIEIKVIVSKLRYWLPAEKQIQVNGAEDVRPETNLQIEGLDTRYAVERLGTEKLYWSVLKEYYQVIEKKAALIRDCVRTQDWARYTIEVHALKSASRQIGATALSERAAELEKAGNAGEIERIFLETEPLLEEYLGYKEILEPYFAKDDVPEKSLFRKDVLKEHLGQMMDAVDNLDIGAMETVLEQMERYGYGEYQEKYERLRAAVEEMDSEQAEEIIMEWREGL